MRALLAALPLLAACSAAPPGEPPAIGSVAFTLDGLASDYRVYDLKRGPFASSAILDLTTSVPTVALYARPEGRRLDEEPPEIDLFGYLTSHPAPGPLEDGILGLRSGADAFGGEGGIVVETLIIDGAQGRMTGRFAGEVCSAAPTDTADPPPVACRDLQGRFDTAIEVRGG